MKRTTNKSPKAQKATVKKRGSFLSRLKTIRSEMKRLARALRAGEVEVPMWRGTVAGLVRVTSMDAAPVKREFEDYLYNDNNDYRLRLLNHEKKAESELRQKKWRKFDKLAPAEMTRREKVTAEEWSKEDWQPARISVADMVRGFQKRANA